MPPINILIASADDSQRDTHVNPSCVGGCRLAVKRFALVASRRPAGDSGAGHPLGGGQVQAGPGLVGDDDRDVLCRLRWRAES